MNSDSWKNDEWTLEITHLGYENFAKNIRLMILECEPPFSIGVYGKWGSGKTSIMRYLMASLNGKPLEAMTTYHDNPFNELGEKARLENWNKIYKDKFNDLNDKKDFNIRSVWFNAWQHQQCNQPLLALLHEIRAQFLWHEKMYGEGKKILNVTFRGGLDIFSDLIKIATLDNIGGIADPGIKIPLTENLQKLGETYEDDHFMTLSQTQRFNMFFEQAIHQLLKIKNNSQSNSRLVIFIDDLDRCEYCQTVKLLESIKLYLSTHNCVFVLGLDPYNVERALAQELKRNPNECHEYLEKLFQSIVRIPISHKYDTYINKLLHGFNNLETDKIDGYDKTLARILEPNPRKVKNFINSLRLYYKIAKDKFAGIDFVKFFIIHYIRMYNPDAYTILEHDPSKITDIKKAINKDQDVSIMSKFLERSFQNLLTENSQTTASSSGGTITSELTDEEYEKLRSDTHYFDRRKAFKELFIANFAAITVDELKPYLIQGA